MSDPLVQSDTKPRLLFVDDEQRVLNSMRIMFRRQFDLFLASHGAEALDIVKDQDIDVIVANHRMPKMTGAEVLTQVRSMSPRTVRILLTGYADLDAVEDLIHEGEVFRFLTKPCPADELRETISLAVKLAREAPVPPPGNDMDEVLSDENFFEIIMASDSAQEVSSTAPSVAESQKVVEPDEDVEQTAPVERVAEANSSQEEEYDPTKTDDIRHSSIEQVAAPEPPAPQACRATGLGIVVLSKDDDVLSTVQNAVRGQLPVYAASNIIQVVNILTNDRPGVLLTDISDNRETIQAMTARLREHLPELVTIAVSQHRDVLDMVWLINHGQIFRFLRKPLSSGRCAVSLRAALMHHRMLLKNPGLVKRHEVADTQDGGVMDGVLSRLKNLKRRWASSV